MDSDKIQSLISDLFDKAKSTDEFEFCCALLRIRGTEAPGWDTLVESQGLINDLISILEAPMNDLFKHRILLLLYCHVTEMDDLYNYIANLLWIVLGERYHIDPFYYELFADRKTINSPENKVNRIVELSTKANLKEVGEIFEYFLVKQVRNAFFHSDYVIYKNEFRIDKGEKVKVDGVSTPIIPFDWLGQRIEVAINVTISLFELINEHRRSYTSEKILPARIGHGGNYEDVSLIVDENGLRGFKSL